MRVRLIVAYEGTNYCGWQIQPNGNTIEKELNKALRDLLQEDIQVIGASRTDSGVHSNGNVAVFDTRTKIPAEKISYALNQRLPEDIVVQKSEQVWQGFHPRYMNSKKTYEYRILNREFRDPNRRRDTYFYYRKLDVQLMNSGAKLFIGEHDFKSFCSAHAQIKTTVRTIYNCSVVRDGDVITISITGAGFLYNMVRIIAGTLIQVGSGERRPDEIASIIASKNRAMAGPTAPAEGLTMMEIVYEENQVEI